MSTPTPPEAYEAAARAYCADKFDYSSEVYVTGAVGAEGHLHNMRLHEARDLEADTLDDLADSLTPTQEAP